jgi:hypothetical protein
MTKKELLGMTKKEIAEVAKEKGIARYKGKSMLTKDELIDKIMMFEDISSDIQKAIYESGVENNLEKQNSKQPLGKQYYIDTIEIGVLVAFRDQYRSGKMNTAKVVNISRKNKKLKLETQYGRQYIISFDEVLWVKTGPRWPSWIYKELKGLVENVE